MTVGIRCSVIHTVKHGVFIRSSLIHAVRTFHCLALMKTQTQNYLLISKCCEWCSAPCTSFLFCCLQRAWLGPFFNLKCGPVLFGMHARRSLSPSQTLPLSVLLPVERDERERMRILIPILHCIKTTPCTDSGLASSCTASVFWICGAEWRVGSLIPVSPIIFSAYC